MNTGAEAWETGVKLSRRWAYDVKKVPENKAVVRIFLSCYQKGFQGIDFSFSTDHCRAGQLPRAHHERCVGLN